MPQGSLVELLLGARVVNNKKHIKKKSMVSYLHSLLMPRMIRVDRFLS